MPERARDTPGKDRTYGAKAAPKRDLRKRGPKAALPKGSGLGTSVSKGVAAAGSQVGSDIGGFGAAAVRGGRNVVAPGGHKAVSRNVGKALEPGKTTPGRVGRNFEVIGDDVLGKSLTNLLQGQPPKNAKDAAGLGFGIAGIFPFGKGIKGVGATVKAARKAEETPVAGPKTLEEKVSIEIYNPHDGFNIYPNDPHPEGFSYSNAWVNADNPFEMIRTGWGAYLAPWEHSQFKPERRGRWVQATIVSENGYIERVNFGNVKARAPGADEKYMEKVAMSALRGNPLRPQGPKTLDETVQGALDGAPEAIAAQNKAYSQERAARATGAMKAYYDNGGGTAGRNAALGELKGALPVIEWNGFTEFTPETLDFMTRHVFEETDLQFYEKVRLAAGLDRVVSGRAPQESQRLLIERVFGKATADSLTKVENRDLLRRLYGGGLKVWNIPRTIMASYDISAPFRQGLVAGARHPAIFARNFKPMLKAFGSEKFTDAIMEEIPTRANFQRYGVAKLNIQDMHGTGPLREEQFPGSYVDSLPGIKNSGRAYTVFLNKMRVDSFDRIVGLAESSGRNVDDPQFLKALGEYINTSTGRGKIPGAHGEDAAQFLNTFLFSPRLLASRFQILNPVYYTRLYRQSPYVAGEALRALGQTLAGVGAMVTLANNIPGTDVGLNPLSADFGKVRIGDTRVDFAGGFQPLIVLYSRLYRKKSVSSSSGQEQDINGGFGTSTRPDMVYRFFQSKMSPSMRLIWDRAAERTYIGDPVTVEGQLWSMAPLNLQGAVNTYETEGSVPAAAGAVALGSIGFGVGSYPDKPAYSRKSKKSDKSKWKQPGSVLPSSSGTDKSGWKQP